MDKLYDDADNQMRKLEEKKRFKSVEDKQVASEVFDNRTLKALYKLANQGYIKNLSGVISTGKEANVFLGFDDDDVPVAVKIYRVATSDFKKIKQYIAGDPRFKTHGHNTRKIITTWTQKEFKNLGRLYNLGLRVPKPYAALENILIMQYLDVSDEDNSGAIPLSKAKIDNPEEVFEEIIDFMASAYNEGQLVHGDLSKYNILMSHGHPYIIDVSQSTLKANPLSHDLLERDINNIIANAKEFNVCLTYGDVKDKIVGK